MESPGLYTQGRLEAPLGEMFTNPRVAVAALRAEDFEDALSAAESGVDRYPLADLEATDLLAERSHFAKQFVTRNDRQFEVRFRRWHWFPLQKAEIAATDTGDLALDNCPVFVGQIRDRHVCELEVRKARKVRRSRLVLMTLTGEENCFHRD